MNTFKIFLSVMAFFLSACSISSVQSNSDLITIGEGNVEVLVPSSLKVLAIDGHPVAAPDLEEGQYRLLLNNGQQRIVVQYEDNWNTGDESSLIIRWHPVTIDSDFQAGERYVLTHAPVKDRQQAEEMGQEAPVWLIGAKQKITGEPAQGEDASVQYESTDNRSDASRLKELQTLWRNARPEDREAFTEWLQQQR